MKFLTKESGKVSMTVVFNVIVLIIGVLDLIQTSPVLPVEYAPYVVLGIGVLNLVLRIWFTTEPISR